MLSLLLWAIASLVEEIRYRRGRKAAPVPNPRNDYGTKIPEHLYNKGWSGKYNDMW